jgi:hypothetical protein
MKPLKMILSTLIIEILAAKTIYCPHPLILSLSKDVNGEGDRG